MFFFRRKNKTRKSRPAPQARRFVHRLPLFLERLEDRTLLSQDIWQAGSGNWDDGANWSLTHAPGTSDTAYISTTSAATITIQSGDTINVQSVSIGSNDTLSITGGSLTVTSGALTLNGTVLNQGLLEADGANLYVNSAAFTNTGTCEAINKGDISIFASTNNSNGLITADGSSTIGIFGTTTGGAIALADGGTLVNGNTANGNNYPGTISASTLTMAGGVS